MQARPYWRARFAELEKYGSTVHGQVGQRGGAFCAADGHVERGHAFAQAAHVAQHRSPVAVPDLAQLVAGLAVDPFAQRQHQPVGLLGAADLDLVACGQAGQANQFFLRADAACQSHAALANGHGLLERSALALLVGPHAQGAHALQVARGVVEQRARLGQRGGVGPRIDQCRHALGQRLETRCGLAGIGIGLRGLGIELGFFGLARGFAGLPGGLLESARRRFGLAAGAPVLGHAGGGARGRAAVLGQPRGALGVHTARHHRRHAVQHGVGHQVVGQRFVAQQLGVLQFLPGTGQLHRVVAGGGFGQFDVEVDAGNGRHSGQRQRGRRQPLQPLLDERAHAGRARQGTAHQAAVLQALLDGFDHEQRVAAAVLHEQRASVPACRPGSASASSNLAVAGLSRGFKVTTASRRSSASA